MAWTYSDWNTQGTAAAKLSRLNLHIQEVVNVGAGVPDVSKDGASRQNGSVNAYLDTLYRQQERLERATGTGAADMYRLTPGRRV